MKEGKEGSPLVSHFEMSLILYIDVIYKRRKPKGGREGRRVASGFLLRNILYYYIIISLLILYVKGGSKPNREGKEGRVAPGFLLGDNL